MTNTIIENKEIEQYNPNDIPLFISVHAIENHKVADMNMESENLIEFSSSLYYQAEHAKNTKSFTFNSLSTEVISEILKLCKQYLKDEEVFNQDFRISANIISERLNQVQIQSEQRNSTMRPPSDGALTINFSPVITEVSKDFKVLISKIDIKEYLERQHAIYEKGFPIENKTQKSCMIDLSIVNDDEVTINSVLVSDSNSTIAAFWTEFFLEITAIRSNLKNTGDAFDSIKIVLNRSVKNQSPTDYTFLNNNLIGYFQRETDYKHEEMLAQVIGDYKPVNKEFDIKGLKITLEKLPSKMKFDTHFTIDNTEIKKKFSRDINISDSIILKTKSHIDDIKKTIIAAIDDSEEKILIIKNISDEAYDAFKQNDTDQD